MNELFWGGFSMVLKPVQSAVFLLVLNCWVIHAKKHRRSPYLSSINSDPNYKAFDSCSGLCQSFLSILPTICCSMDYVTIVSSNSNDYYLLMYILYLWRWGEWSIVD
jgi:hypothetical protein